MEEEFDLLAGHDLGESAFINGNGDGSEDAKILVWHKMETEGFQPSAREVSDRTFWMNPHRV